MSMWSNISQLKQSLTDEFQQSKKNTSDPISTIERNSQLLTAQPANVDDIIASLSENLDTSFPHRDSAEKSDLSEAKASPTSISTEPPPPPANNPATGNQTELNEPQVTSDPSPQTSTSHQTTLNANIPRDTNEFREPKSELPILSPQISRSQSPAASTNENFSSKLPDPSVEAKLAKFAKYESMYPKLLKAYKEEKKRQELVKIYEKVLSEHTPCQSVAEPQKLVDFVNELKRTSDRQFGDITKLTTQNQQLVSQNQQLVTENSNLKREQAQLSANLDQTTSDLHKLQAAHEQQQNNHLVDAELQARLESLASQLRLAEQKRDASMLSLKSTRSQLEELNTRLKETLAESDSLRDELQDSEIISQERLKELNTLKNIMRSREKDDRAAVNQTDSELATLRAEKEILESEIEVLNKRVIRESEQLQLQIKSLRSRLLESETSEDELRTQISVLRDNQSRMPQPHDLQQRSNSAETSPKLISKRLSVSEPPNHALYDANLAVANATKANELLKQVNKDSTLRIEKLQRAQKVLAADLEHLRHENSLLRRQARPAVPSNLTSTKSESLEDREKQQAYLKNVLLGFIEHKDQRKALIPVLATLLDLKNSESEKFMNGFA